MLRQLPSCQQLLEGAKTCPVYSGSLVPFFVVNPPFSVWIILLTMGAKTGSCCQSPAKGRLRLCVLFTHRRSYQEAFGGGFFCSFNTFVPRGTWENLFLVGSWVPFILSLSNSSFKNILQIRYLVTRSLFEKQTNMNIYVKNKVKISPRIIWDAFYF